MAESTKTNPYRPPEDDDARTGPSQWKPGPAPTRRRFRKRDRFTNEASSKPLIITLLISAIALPLIFGFSRQGPVIGWLILFGVVSVILRLLNR